MSKIIPETPLAKVNLFLEQYRSKGLAPKVGEQEANIALQKKLNAIDSQKLGKDSQETERANDWFDVWFNVWSNHAMENDKEPQELENNSPKFNR